MMSKDPDTPQQMRVRERLSTYIGSAAKFLGSLSYTGPLILGGCLLLAILIRVSLIDFKSVDFLKYSRVWYNSIQHDGFQVFETGFNLDVRPQMYMLYLVVRFLPDLPPVVATKIPSLLGDFICALLAFLIIRLKFREGPWPAVGGLGVLFAPTVILNSAMWGQSDSLFTAALLAFLYFFLLGRQATACLAYGLALAFKPQAVFLLPLVGALFLKNFLSWKHMLLVPAVILIMLAPPLLGGRSPAQLVIDYGSGVQQYEMLSMNAPNLYSVLPGQGPFYALLLPAGVILTAGIALLFVFLVYSAPPAAIRPGLIELALAVLLLMPFFLPKMHERYFYPADVLSIIYAFYSPKYYFVPLTISTVSFLAYLPFLFNREPVSMPVLMFALLAMICIVMHQVIRQLFSPDDTETAAPAGAPQ